MSILIYQQKDVNNLLTRVLLESEPNLSYQMAPYQMKMLTKSKLTDRMMPAVFEGLGSISLPPFMELPKSLTI
jgi:hypothetical protein